MKRFFLLSLAFLAVVACQPAKPNDMLVRVTRISTDATCPAGGLIIATGRDANADGVLDDAEVTQSSELCNGQDGARGDAGLNGSNGLNGVDGGNGRDGTTGANGTAALVNTVDLPAGDAHCTSGGVRLEIGLDDGRGGGVANDGVLQAGEVRDTRYLCNAGTPHYPGTVTLPAGDAGTAVLDVSGGDSDAGGANAGTIDVSMEGTLGGSVAVFATGSLDASVVVPALTFTGGAYPVTISTTTSLKVFPTTAEGVDAGAALFTLTDGRVYAVDAGLALQVTGVSVATGATLTIEGGNLVLPRDLSNAGTITSAPLGAGRANLGLNVDRYLGAAGSAITLDAVDAGAGTDGVAAGALNLTAHGGLLNQGALTSRGGPGAAGGAGGTMALVSNRQIASTGLIDTSGGSGSTTQGGQAGRLDVSGGGVGLAGQVLARGGEGTTMAGSANSVSVSSTLAPLVVTGTLDASAGPCAAVAGASCEGAGGATISFDTYAGDFLLTGQVLAEGRPGQGTGKGGWGGALNVNLRVGGPSGSTAQWPMGSLASAGTISLRGAAGTPGGAGGNLSIRGQTNRLGRGQELRFVGYAELRANGGSGSTAGGGSGGTVNLYSDSSLSAAGNSAPSGPVLLSAAISARGGNGATGGSGGNVSLYTNQDLSTGDPAETLRVSAARIDARGGRGGGSGGQVNLTSYWSIENHAALNVTAGLGDGTVDAAPGGTLSLSGGMGGVENLGAMDASGADATGSRRASTGGSITLVGSLVKNSGALTSRGGSSTTVGAAGGQISLGSITAATQNSGTFDVSGGTGPGSTTGVARVDGALQ